MSKTPKGEKKGNGYGDRTWVMAKMILSPACRSLGVKGSCPVISTCSRVMLDMLLLKRQYEPARNKKNIKGKVTYVRTDENKFTLTYKELASFGITQPRATRGFDELLWKGFISIARQGGAYDQDKSQYSLEEDYLRWRPGDGAIRTREKSVISRGWQGRKKIKTTYVDVAQGRIRQCWTPEQDTHTPTLDTHILEKEDL